MVNPNLELKIKPGDQIPHYLVGEIESKLAYVDEQIKAVKVPLDGTSITLSLKTELNKRKIIEIEAKVERVVETMAAGAIEPKTMILEDFTERPVPNTTDPLPELLDRGEIFEESTGVYTLGPLMTRLMKYFEVIFLDLAESFDAEPYHFPTLIPAKYLDRVNYFRAFPHSLTFTTHLREDLDVIDHFSEHAACDENGGLNSSADSFAKIQTLLSPAVCYHLYFSLADKELAKGKLTATAVGNCFRYEATNLTSLERLWNFTMREVIFVGSKDFVLENRDIARNRMASALEKIGMAYRVESANDPFFIGEFKKQAAFQSAFQLKFEIRANLPFKKMSNDLSEGDRVNNTLAVGSYNYHQDFFGRSLNITLPDGTPAHTGCVAFGLERVAFAFLAQFGLDQKHWPKEMKGSV